MISIPFWTPVILTAGLEVFQEFIPGVYEFFLASLLLLLVPALATSLGFLFGFSLWAFSLH